MILMSNKHKKSKGEKKVIKGLRVGEIPKIRLPKIQPKIITEPDMDSGRTDYKYSDMVKQLCGLMSPGTRLPVINNYTCCTCGKNDEEVVVKDYKGLHFCEECREEFKKAIGTDHD